MKNLFFIVLGSLLVLTSCSKETESSELVSNKLKENSKSKLVFTDCPNQDWDGNIDHDCYPPEGNCAVICAESVNSIYYSDFKIAVENGTIADFYLNGPGMEVLPVSNEAYNQIISKEKKIVKVDASITDKYALY